jgi:hypothetical protein
VLERILPPPVAAVGAFGDVLGATLFPEEAAVVAQESALAVVGRLGDLTWQTKARSCRVRRWPGRRSACCADGGSPIIDC